MLGLIKVHTEFKNFRVWPDWHALVYSFCRLFRWIDNRQKLAEDVFLQRRFEWKISKVYLVTFGVFFRVVSWRFSLSHDTGFILRLEKSIIDEKRSPKFTPSIFYTLHPLPPQKMCQNSGTFYSNLKFKKTKNRNYFQNIIQFCRS